VVELRKKHARANCSLFVLKPRYCISSCGQQQIVLMYPGTQTLQELNIMPILTGLLITFIFLGLNNSCRPYCTYGLSNLHSLSLVAQFITLFGGVVLVLQYYIRREAIQAGEEDKTTVQNSLIQVLIFACNGAILIWPAFEAIANIDRKKLQDDFHDCAVKFSLLRTADKSQPTEKNPDINLMPISNMTMIKEHFIVEAANAVEDNKPANAENISVFQVPLVACEIPSLHRAR
jgi:hypothetical protein